MELRNHRAEVAHLAGGARIGKECGEDRFRLQVLQRVADHHLMSEGARTRLDDADGLRMRVTIDEKCIGGGLHHAPGHGHGLSRGGCLVEERGIGDLKAGHVDDHLLEVQQRLKAALAHLSLIGRVGGVPARVLQHVAQDHLGRHRAVVTHADHRDEHIIPVGHPAKVGKRRAFRHRLLQFQRALGADRVWHHAGDEIIKRLGAEASQHLGGVGLVRPDVTGHEIRAGLELGKGGAADHLVPQPFTNLS